MCLSQKWFNPLMNSTDSRSTVKIVRFWREVFRAPFPMIILISYSGRYPIFMKHSFIRNIPPWYKNKTVIIKKISKVKYMIMKKLFFFLCFVLPQYMLVAQGDMVVNVSRQGYLLQEQSKGVRLTEVLKAIEKKHNAFFSYDPALLEHTMVRELSGMDGDLEYTLETVLASTGLRYQRMGENYYTILPERKTLTNPESNASESVAQLEFFQQEEIRSESKI